MTPNGYAAQAYRGIQVNTASPAELTLMLCNRAIKFYNVAELGIDNNDILKAHTNIMKAERIIEGTPEYS